ncbi:MAG: DNA polymerase III subunit beta [Sulfurovum sp.]|nr:MAG: DNA polymerase III subunit beta [Sulfurovum sp.]
MKSNRFGLRSSDLEDIIKTLKQFDNICEAIIFGSRAKGNYKHGSDVDIAIKGDIDFKTLTHLSYLLNEESLMPYKFDIVNYGGTQHHDLKEHIDRIGISIYHKDILVSA